MTETRERELTTKEAAELAGVSDAYIRQLLIAGKLTGRKLNDWMWLVSRSALQRWMETRKAEG